jgi:hypothetical protein
MPNNSSAGWQSFSGSDIKAVFMGKVVGSLKSISVTVQREKAPIYIMGYPEPKGFSRGKRGIAGTAVFAVFDKSEILSTLSDSMVYVRPDQVNMHEALSRQSPLSTPTLFGDLLSQSDITANTNLSELQGAQHPAWYLDQIPPITIVLSGMNEFGKQTTMSILGVEFLNQGTGTSVEDIRIDETVTWVAISMTSWMAGQPLGRQGGVSGYRSTGH